MAINVRASMMCVVLVVASSSSVDLARLPWQMIASLMVASAR